MLRVITTMSSNGGTTVTLSDFQVDKAVQGAIEAIKKELPGEALSEETFEYVTERIMEKVKTAKIVL